MERKRRCIGLFIVALAIAGCDGAAATPGDDFTDGATGDSALTADASRLRSDEQAAASRAVDEARPEPATETLAPERDAGGREGLVAAPGPVVYLQEGDIWRLDQGARRPVRLTYDGWVSVPVPSPSGSLVAYLSIPEEDRPEQPWAGILPHDLRLIPTGPEEDPIALTVSTEGAEPGVPDWDAKTGALVWGEDDRIMRLVPGAEPEELISGLEPLLYGVRGSVHPKVSHTGLGITWDECSATSCRLRLMGSDGELGLVSESDGIVPFWYEWVVHEGREMIAWTGYGTGSDEGTWSVYDPVSGSTTELEASLALMDGNARAIAFAVDGRLKVVDFHKPTEEPILISPAPHPLPSGLNDVTWVTGEEGESEAAVVYRVAEPEDRIGLYAVQPPTDVAAMVVAMPQRPTFTESQDGRPRGLGVARRFVLLGESP